MVDTNTLSEIRLELCRSILVKTARNHRARLEPGNLGKVEAQLGMQRGEVEVAAGQERAVAPPVIERFNDFPGHIIVEIPGTSKVANHLLVV